MSVVMKKARNVTNNNELRLVSDIAKQLNVKYSLFRLNRIENEQANSFEIPDNNQICFYPLNDGMPTRGINFYKNGELIISNSKEFSQISNLDEIILKMIRIYSESLDSGIILDPYYFMLELTDDICKDYHGRADLVITEKTIRNNKLNNKNFDEANKYFINHFLDHFIGWNFGLSVNRNEIVKKELEKLNEKVINMGLREWAGSGYEVIGTAQEEHNGLQHYKLPTEKAKIMQKVNYYTTQ